MTKLSQDLAYWTAFLCSQQQGAAGLSIFPGSRKCIWTGLTLIILLELQLFRVSISVIYVLLINYFLKCLGIRLSIETGLEKSCLKNPRKIHKRLDNGPINWPNKVVPCLFLLSYICRSRLTYGSVRETRILETEKGGQLQS